MERVDIEDPRELGEVIRAVRVHSGLTQVDAAALCGVSTPFLNALEGGKPSAQLKGILAVCRGLGIRFSLGPPFAVEELQRTPSRKPRASRK